MELSIVIQGPVSGFTTPCCESVRRLFPGAEVILSTWKGENTDGLSFDKLVLSDDPGTDNGPVLPCGVPILNISRQVRSSLNGIRATSGQLVMKTRTDSVFLGRGCLDHLGLWPKRGPMRVFESRVVVPNLHTCDPDVGHRAFNISDWAMLGTRKDLEFLFDIPLEGAKTTNKSPEQYIWLSAVRKRFPDVDISSMDIVSEKNMLECNRFIADNLVILQTHSQFAFHNMRYETQNEDHWTFLKHDKFTAMYNAI